LLTKKLVSFDIRNLVMYQKLKVWEKFEVLTA